MEGENQNYFNEIEAPPIILNNNINVNNENQSVQIQSNHEPNKMLEYFNLPPNNGEQILPNITQNQPNIYNLNYSNITNNETQNKFQIPKPYNNSEINKPLVIPQYDSIQQNNEINQNPKFTIPNPYQNSEIHYQVQITNQNNIMQQPKEKEKCSSGWCCCWICCGTCCGCIILAIILFFVIMENIKSSFWRLFH